MSVFTDLVTLLRSLGLGELVSVDASGRPTGWLADQIAQGVDTPEELGLAIENTDVWRQRYGVIVAQREAAARGEPVRPMTMGEVRQTEEAFASLARYYQMPPSTYDDYRDFQQYMLRGITPEQWRDSALRSYDRVRSAPPEVRAVFGEWFGPRGDSMLAAYFLDPEHVNANIERITNAAVAGGYARAYGFEAAQDRAFRLADRNISEAELARGYAELQARSALFRETATDIEDLEAGREGVDVAFDLNAPGSAERIQRRVGQRVGAFGGGGGALDSNRGVVGVGAGE